MPISSPLSRQTGDAGLRYSEFSYRNIWPEGFYLMCYATAGKSGQMVKLDEFSVLPALESSSPSPSAPASGTDLSGAAGNGDILSGFEWIWQTLLIIIGYVPPAVEPPIRPFLCRPLVPALLPFHLVLR